MLFGLDLTGKHRLFCFEQVYETYLLAVYLVVVILSAFLYNNFMSEK